MGRRTSAFVRKGTCVVSAGTRAALPPRSWREQLFTSHVAAPLLVLRPGFPQPFSLDDSERLAGVLRDGRPSDVVVTKEATPCRAASVDEWWERSCALAGPLAQRLAALPEPAARALRASAADAAGRYRTSSGAEFPGVTLVAAASRS